VRADQSAAVPVGLVTQNEHGQVGWSTAGLAVKAVTLQLSGAGATDTPIAVTARAGLQTEGSQAQRTNSALPEQARQTGMSLTPGLP
jgi:hypothetical protein